MHVLDIRTFRSDQPCETSAEQRCRAPTGSLAGRRTAQPGPLEPDRPTGLRHARIRLVKTISELNLTNVVIASRDAHIHAVSNVTLRDDELDGPAVAAEFLATSISSGGDGAAANHSTRHARRQPPHAPGQRPAGLSDL